uniref:Membrane magnesium transporter n=1 Tax=Phaeomonas parva TaxID=124430 RepID=A0A7S1U2P6_9STRA|mmetsp:Transcript_28940/g.92524  ORF Transcript_28940/g.92524 Transcript_28940/m.92524 type:complete len:120 (+) Transcript_28940:40-399(+)
MPSTLNPNLKVVLLLVLHATMAASSALSVGFMLANPALLRYNDRNMDFADAAALTHAALALGFCATAVLLARHLPPRLLRAGGVDLQLANPTVAFQGNGRALGGSGGAADYKSVRSAEV